MSALIAILLGSAGGIGLGSIGPVGVESVLKSLPIVLKAAKYGAHYMSQETRAATEKEIAVIERSGAARAMMGGWFR
jgi:hypothetical protein